MAVVMMSLALTVATVYGSKPGAVHSESRIVRGTPTSATEYPFIVDIRVNYSAMAHNTTTTTTPSPILDNVTSNSSTSTNGTSNPNTTASPTMTPTLNPTPYPIWEDTGLS